MRLVLLGGAVAALALTACQAPTVSTPVPATRHVLHIGDDGGAPLVLPSVDLGKRLRPVSASADSTLGALTAARVIDGDVGSYWANGVNQEPEVAVTFKFPAKQAFRWARIKTGPLPHGVTYKFMVSQDGKRWEPASGRLINTTWDMQLQELQGEGQYLRMRLFNHMVSPSARFKVYEAEFYGGPATGRTTFRED